MNVGTTVLTSAQINYQLDNGTAQQYNWTGSLNQWQAQTISLPIIQFAAGNHTFSATVSNPNQALDENATNNQSVANIVVTAGET